MPKAGTVTVEIEPIAVLQGITWLVKQDPYENPTLFIAVLPASEQQLKKLEYIKKVKKVTERCLKWLKRKPATSSLRRIETPFEKHALNLPREVAKWLGGYWKSNSGIFGLRTPKREPSADWFFLSCYLASDKKMGRPKLTREQLEQRTTGEVGEHYKRFMRDRRRLEQMPVMPALLALSARE